MRSPVEWLFGPADARRLATLRIGLFTTLAIRMSRGIYLELAGQPAALFRPRSFMTVFDRMPARPVVLAVQVAGVALAVSAALGFRARITMVGAWLCALFLGGMHNSIGKVMHNDILLLMAIVPLLPAHTADVWSLDTMKARTNRWEFGGVAAARRYDFGALEAANPPRSNLDFRYGWPVHTAQVVVAGAYFFAGLAKLVNSGVAWVTSQNMRWILYASSDSQPTPNELALFIANRPLLSMILAAATLTFELSFPLALLHRRLAFLYVAGAVMLHAGISATMRLDYSAWIATVIVVFIDWKSVGSKLRAAKIFSRSGKFFLLFLKRRVYYKGVPQK